MSIEAIVDAAAVKAATVTGIKAAYGSSAGDTSVRPLPSGIADGPIAVVMWTGTEVIVPTTFEALEHELVVWVYVSGADEGYAYKTLLPFVARFIAAWRTDRDLGGTCVESWVSRVDAIEPAEMNSREYVRLPVRVTVREVTVGAATSV